MPSDTDLLIIGAGPFGAAQAAHAAAHGLDHIVVGRPMAFWRENMPAGMLLRSSCDWHLDPLEEHTIDRYLATRRQTCREVEPLPLDFYLGYTEWFLREKGIEPVDETVRRLDRIDGHYTATMASGTTIRARRVLVAIGLRHFGFVSAELAARLPPGRFTHSCDFVELDTVRGQRCLIVGGRQSAFEWAALMREAGAAAIDICYRHDTPSFAPSDWSWVAPLVERIRDQPGWYRRLPEAEQQGIADRLWLEGRSKLEPWLWPRLDYGNVRLWPGTQPVGCDEAGAGALQVRLDTGQSVVAERILMATGYRVDLGRVPLLRDGNLWDRLETADGYPILDESFQTSHRGLFITGQPATRAFGPLFGFTVSVRASAEVIGRALLG